MIGSYYWIFHKNFTTMRPFHDVEHLIWRGSNIEWYYTHISLLEQSPTPNNGEHVMLQHKYTKLKWLVSTTGYSITLQPWDLSMMLNISFDEPIIKNENQPLSHSWNNDKRHKMVIMWCCHINTQNWNDRFLLLDIP